MAERRLFHISFNPEIPSHAAAIQYLDSLGRKKASAIAKALEAAGCTGDGTATAVISSPVPLKTIHQEAEPNPVGQGTDIRSDDQASETSWEIPEIQEQENSVAQDIPASSENQTPVEPEESQEKAVKDDDGIPEVYRNTLMANLNYFDSMEEDDEDL